MCESKREYLFFWIQVLFSVIPALYEFINMRLYGRFQITILGFLFAIPFVWFLASTIIIMLFTYRKQFADNKRIWSFKFIKYWLSTSVFSMGLHYIIYDLICYIIWLTFYTRRSCGNDKKQIYSLLGTNSIITCTNNFIYVTTVF